MSIREAGSLAAISAEEINQLESGQPLSRTPGHEHWEYHTVWGRWLKEAKIESLSLAKMIRSQDACDVVSGIRGSKNIRNCEDRK